MSTKTYTYGNSQWGDQLTGFNGTAITYDAIGNPLSYYNGNSYTFTWSGRQLTGAVKGDKTMSCTYDAWGRQTVTYTNNGASTTAANNPFRYRGYYHDADLNLYYLNARYSLGEGIGKGMVLIFG